MIRKQKAIAIIKAGGFIRFTWKTCTIELFNKNEKNCGIIDGRSYTAITKQCNIRDEFNRHNHDPDNLDDLIIEWRIRPITKE